MAREGDVVRVRDGREEPKGEGRDEVKILGKILILDAFYPYSRSGRDETAAATPPRRPSTLAIGPTVRATTKDHRVHTSCRPSSLAGSGRPHQDVIRAVAHHVGGLQPVVSPTRF